MLKQSRLLLASAAAMLVAASGPVSAQQAGEPRVAIISSEVKALAETPNVADDVMDAAMRELFQGAGYTVEVIPEPEGARWLSDRQLAQIGRQVGARFVVYPKILTLGSTAEIAVDPAPGTAVAVAVTPGMVRTSPVLYSRIIDVMKPGDVKTVYMRQVAFPWQAPPPGNVHYAERPAIPLGVAYLFRFYEPLNERLMARGMPSLQQDPGTVTARLWPEERVAAFREEFREE